MSRPSTSGVAADCQRVLDEWPAMSASFVKVMPEDYKRVLLERSASNDTEAEAAAAA